jgi:hypothetical protein
MMIFTVVIVVVESTLKIDSIDIKVDCSTYENGRINWMICSDETCAMLKGMTLNLKIFEEHREYIVDVQNGEGLSILRRKCILLS